jgi:hypothetical protein
MRVFAIAKYQKVWYNLNIINNTIGVNNDVKK